MAFPIWKGCCSQSCFTCSAGELLVSVNNWTGASGSYTCTTPGGLFSNGVSVGFARRIVRGLYFTYTYSTDGVLAMPIGGYDASTGMLEALNGYGYPMPSSGTVVIKSSAGDLDMFDDDNNPVVPIVWNAYEVYVNGSWLFSAEGRNGVWGSGSGYDMGFQFVSGTTATVGGFAAEKIYETRGCEQTVGTWPWPAGQATRLTMDIAVANLTKPPPAESELPCEDCASLSGSFTLYRVDDGLMTDEAPGYGGFSANGGLTQLWMAPCNNACPVEFSGIEMTGSGFEYAYVMMVPGHGFIGGGQGGVYFGMVADYEHPLLEFAYGFGGVVMQDLYNGNSWSRGSASVLEEGTVSDTVITVNRTLSGPLAPAGGTLCRHTTCSITAHYD